jgi:GH24 family phage-related lysozyme (muramidase)
VTTTNFDFLDARIDRRLATDIDAAEGNELVAYPDSLGNWTIGRGHLLPQAAPGRSWHGFTILPAVSDRYFNGDLLQAIDTASKWPEFAKCDTLCRQNALREIAFNMAGKWAQFVKTRTAIEAQDWQAVHDNLLWNAPGIPTPWYAEVKGRAVRIANQFLKGEYDQVGNGP